MPGTRLFRGATRAVKSLRTASLVRSYSNPSETKAPPAGIVSYHNNFKSDKQQQQEDTQQTNETGSFRALFPLGFWAVTSTALFSWYCLKNSQQEPIIAEPYYDGTKPSQIVLSSELVAAGNTPVAGHSHAKRVKFKGTNGTQVFYLKYTFTKRSLVNELFLGSLAHYLAPETFPSYYAVQHPVADQPDKAQYAVLSQSYSKQLGITLNLEDWAIAFLDDQYIGKPRRLAVALAYSNLIGLQDIKLQNLIMLLTHDEEVSFCYPIDFESAYSHNVHFIYNAEEAMNTILEYQPIPADGINEVMEDSPYQPLRGDYTSKRRIYRPLLEAIESDLDEVNAFYEKFVAVTEKDMDNIIEGFNGLITPQEGLTCKRQIKQRQEEVRTYLQNNVVTKPTVLVKM